MAISKIIFCVNISQDTRTMLKLFWNTKQFTRRPKKAVSNEKAKHYNLRLPGRNHEVFLRTCSGDIAIFYEIFWQRAYRLPKKCYEDARIIVDLGANIGLASLYFQSMCPAALIYAVEPEDSNFEVLAKNLREGILQKKVVLIRAAIYSEDGEASIKSAQLRYNSRIIPAAENGPVVKTMAMNTLMKAFSINKIDILKIDIEGAEQQLLEADTEWLDNVNYLLVEFHSPMIKSFCLELLSARNWTVHSLQPGNKNNDMFWAENNSFRKALLP